MRALRIIQRKPVCKFERKVAVSAFPQISPGCKNCSFKFGYALILLLLDDDVLAETVSEAEAAGGRRYTPVLAWDHMRRQVRKTYD